jgi:hypothetical protein
MTGHGLGEGLEAPIHVDVIHHECAPWFYGGPSCIQLEAHVPFTVQAVVNEEINLAKLREQLRKAASAGTLDV